MDYNEVCKESCQCENHEIGMAGEANIESYDSEIEEGEIIEKGEPPRSASSIHKDKAASAVELSLSAQEAVEKEQVNIRQSTSPERASHRGGTASIVVVQQSKYSAIHKDMAANVILLRSTAQEAVGKEQNNIRQSTLPERGSHQVGTASTVVVQQSKCSAIHEDMAANAIELSTSAQGAVEEDLSTSAERGSHQGVTASTAFVQKSKYSASEGRHVNVRQSTLHSTYSGKRRRSYSPSVYISSKERHKQRKRGCFKYSDYEWVLKMIEEVCSERSNKLLLRQNGGLKEFKIVCKEQESEFFQEHVHFYKIHYAHVMPTRRYCRMKLPKQHFSILRERFHKHIRSQLKFFIRQQLNDRDKENRIKQRWIFEASAGYLKTYFYTISLSYSEFKLEKLEWHMTDFSDGEEQLKYFDMQALNIQIEAIASNRESAGQASGVSDPILENPPSLLEINGATKLRFSVGVSEEMAILESRSSQPNCAPTMEFGEKDGTQIALSAKAAAQNKRGSVDKPYASPSAALEPAEAVTAGKVSDVPEPVLEDSSLLLETNGATKLGFSAGLAEEMSNLEISPPQSTCAPTLEFGVKVGTQIAFSAAAQNEGENVERPCGSPSVQSAALELAVAVTNDSENAPPIFREKRRRISSGYGVSEGPCSRPQRKFPHKPASDLCRMPLHHEEPPAARSPSVNNNQMVQAVDTGSKEIPSGQTSSCAQVIEQANMNSYTQSVTNQQCGGSTCQTASHPYQPPGVNTHSVRTGANSLRASNVQSASANQVPTGSSPEQLAEDGLQPNPFTIELNHLNTLRDLVRKRHKEKREQLILACEIDMAQAKRKYDELIYNSEMEVLQRKRDLKIKCDKVYKQLILAEGFQVMCKASAGVISYSPRGAARRTMAEPNQSSGQHVFQFSASVSAPASEAMYQSPQSSVQPSTGTSLRQYGVTTQHSTMNSSGRSINTLMRNPSGGMGNGPAYHR